VTFISNLLGFLKRFTNFLQN